MAGIAKMESATSVFAGQGDLFVFAPVTDYGTATFTSLSDPKSLGQIVQDSTEWNGEDPETAEIKDEQGNIITAKVSAGTLGFAFDIASTSQAMIIKFLKGANISNLTNDAFATGATVTGFGVDLPVVTLPICIVNDEKTKSWLYPKAKITSNLAYSDGLWRIHCSVVCEYLNTASLKTAMLIEAAVQYAAVS